MFWVMTSSSRDGSGGRAGGGRVMASMVAVPMAVMMGGLVRMPAARLAAAVRLGGGGEQQDQIRIRARAETIAAGDERRPGRWA